VQDIRVKLPGLTNAKVRANAPLGIESPCSAVNWISKRWIQASYTPCMTTIRMSSCEQKKR